MKSRYSVFLLGLLSVQVHALSISEIFSNPVGDDSGREWVEVINDSDGDIDISKISIGTKGGKQIPVLPLSSDKTTLSKGEVLVIGSTLAGQTKVFTDYPDYKGAQAKATFSLVNTGETSLELYYDGAQKDQAAYTPAKEGKSVTKSGGVWIEGVPSLGDALNSISQPVNSFVPDTKGGTDSSLGMTIQNSVVEPQTLLVKVPQDRIVIAGAETEYASKVSLATGKLTRPYVVHWSFGDGGEKYGATTSYAYIYDGVYLATVDVESDDMDARAHMKVKVIAPNISVSRVGSDANGSYIEITNPNQYELLISQWKLWVDGVQYNLPKGTTLLASSTTKISGKAVGFSSLSFSSSTEVRLLFPNNGIVSTFAVGNNNTPVIQNKQGNIVNRFEEAKEVGVSVASRAKVFKTMVTPHMERVYAYATSSVSTTTMTKKESIFFSFIKKLFDAR